MFGIEPIKNFPPVFGMNTVDDIYDLREGECVELVNARPGNPPEIRKGCDVWLITGTSGYTLVPPWIVYKTDGGTQYIICWVQDGDDYHLVKINTDLKPPTILIIGTATNLSYPYFDFIKLHNSIYANINESMTWEDDSTLVGNKIIIPGEINSTDEVREQSIRSIPSITSVELTASGIWTAATDDFITYAVTYVKHSDAVGFSGGKPVQVTSYNPGINEGFEEPTYRETIEIVGSNVGILINLATGYSRRTAQNEGATHVRIYKSLRQNTADDAEGATKYWMKDVPLITDIKDISDITLDKNPVKITTVENHGCLNSESVRIYGVLGTTELNENDYTVVNSDSAKVFRLSGTDPSNFSRYVSGGHVLKNPVNISNITTPDNTITVQTSVDHNIGTDTRRRVVMENITGSTQLNNVLLTPRSTPGVREVIFENPGLAIDAYVSGGNIHVFWNGFAYVDNIDKTGTYVNVSLRLSTDGVFSSYWSNPVGKIVTFDNLQGSTELNGEVCTVTAAVRYHIYVGGQDWYGWMITLNVLSSSISTPSDTTGRKIYIAMNTSTISISALSFTSSKPVVTTSSPHGLSNSDDAFFYDITGTTELNGNYYEVSEVSSTQFSLPYETAFNLSTYISGGVASYHAAVIDEVFLCYPLITVYEHGLEDNDSINIDEVIGSDELNENNYQVEIIDDDSFYILDVDSNDISNYDYGGIIYLGGLGFEDDVSEATLIADPAPVLVAHNYAYAPNAKYVEFVKSRMWLFGIEGYPSMAFYSEAPGEDGGTPTDYALAYPQKFASWFKDSYAVYCDTVKGATETGIKRLIDDIYFFFEERIFALFGGDPAVGAPTEISKDIGCPFPYTIVRANVPYLGGICLLFISNKGPAVIKKGGEVELFPEFTHKELWPGDDSEIFEDLSTSATTKQHIQRNCNAMFWQEAWTIAYTNYSGSHKIFEYYFNPELNKDLNAPHGAYEIELADI